MVEMLGPRVVVEPGVRVCPFTRMYRSRSSGLTVCELIMRAGNLVDSAPAEEIRGPLMSVALRLG